MIVDDLFELIDERAVEAALVERGVVQLVDQLAVRGDQLGVGVVGDGQAAALLIR